MDDMAAETAAKILHTMSAKKARTTMNRRESEGDTGSQSDPKTSIRINKTNTVLDIFPHEESIEQSLVFETSLPNEEDSPLPKKKRKSVPSKIITKEGADVEGTIPTEGIKSTDSENSQQKGIITPVKRKQLKPKCLPFPISNNDKNVDESVHITQSSTRRKQKAVAKATVSTPEEIQDEAEQEWQGMDSDPKDKEACDISGELLVDLQKENDNSITTFSTDDSNSNIDARTSFSNLLNDVIGTSIN